jgi:hypothetical protein
VYKLVLLMLQPVVVVGEYLISSHHLIAILRPGSDIGASKDIGVKALQGYGVKADGFALAIMIR